MSMQRRLPDKADHADPWTLCCAKCAQIMRITTAKPSREGTETRTYACACGYREILDVPLH
jgi:lysyl-tRNA synthetase class I